MKLQNYHMLRLMYLNQITIVMMKKIPMRKVSKKNQCHGLKTNNTLEELYLYNNNITDDGGIQSIIDGLKTNNTLKTLWLHDNELSSNMISQLNAIQQYKKDGSNGYQQVEEMYIMT